MKEKKIPWWFKRKEDKLTLGGVPDYTIVSSVSGALIRLLREAMVPGVLEGRDMIGLCAPDDHRDTTLGVWLYDIRENDELRVNGMLPFDDNQLTYPPIYLNLHYMVTAYSDMDLRYRAEEEHRLLAKVMQVLRDSSVLDSDTLMPTEAAGPSDLRIEFQNLSMDEKMKVWNGLHLPYRLSLFYRIAPVELESMIRRKASRVTEFQVEERL